MPESGTQALRARHQEPDEEGFFSIRYEPAYVDSNTDEPSEILQRKVRDNQKIKLSCQQIASVIWKEEPDWSGYTISYLDD